MVARQFRVLEAASSSPATSTKNTGEITSPLYFCPWCHRLDEFCEAECECANLYTRVSSLLVNRVANYFAEGKAPATIQREERSKTSPVFLPVVSQTRRVLRSRMRVR